MFHCDLARKSHPRKLNISTRKKSSPENSLSSDDLLKKQGRTLDRYGPFQIVMMKDSGGREDRGVRRSPCVYGRLWSWPPITVDPGFSLGLRIVAPPSRCSEQPSSRLQATRYAARWEGPGLGDRGYMDTVLDQTVRDVPWPAERSRTGRVEIEISRECLKKRKASGPSFT